MKLGLICDLHMPESENSPQWVFCKKALDSFKKSAPDFVITLGDIVSFGEYGAFEKYIKVTEGLNHHFILGNSEVRDKNTEKLFLEKSIGFEISADKKRIIGINTPYAFISESDKSILSSLSDGDIIMLHHSIQGLNEDSKNFITQLTEDKALTIIHAHSHKAQDYTLGRSHIIGLRALDPDKSIGDFPCITYLDTDTMELSEELFTISKEVLKDISMHFGISCVDNRRDLQYAEENGVYGVELRCNGKDWQPDLTLLPLIESWRKKTGGYLSVHMPNLHYANGNLKGADNWYKAVEYANAVKADGLTMHPPRVSLGDFEESRDLFLQLYTYAVENVSATVKIGIENIHMKTGEADDINRGFGYTPDEVMLWIDAINNAVGFQRVGHTFDVGHARNNEIYASKYPISRWYESMGNKTVAYHIHQVIRGENEYSNHTAIENWFGPMISYASYFYSWENGLINHMPIFLEVRGCENYDKSLKAFRLLS